MGLFIKNHGQYDSSTVTNTQQYYQNNDPVAYGINAGVSIFGTLLTKIGDGQGGDDEGAKISERKQRQIDELQSNIDSILSSAGFTSVEGLSGAITTSQEAQKTLTSEITGLDTNINDNKSKIEDLSKKATTLESQLTGDATKDANINEQLATIRANKSTLEQQNLEFEKQKTAKTQQLEAEKKKEVELTATKAEVENYQHRIDKIKKSLPKEVNYNVKKETADLQSFSTALKAFQSNPSSETAQAVKDAYTGGHKGVQNATAQKAYELLVQQYPQYFGQKTQTK